MLPLYQDGEIKADSNRKSFHRPPRPRLPVSSVASSSGNSPRGREVEGSKAPSAPSSSSGSQPPRLAKISKSSSNSSLSSIAGANVESICQALTSKSSEDQIWALKKLRFDLELCRRLVDEDRHVLLSRSSCTTSNQSKQFYEGFNKKHAQLSAGNHAMHRILS